MNDLERLVAIEDIRRVMAAYVHHADLHQWRDLADLFEADGTFTPLKVDGTEWTVMSGQEQIAAALGSNAGPNDVVIHHLFSDEIDVHSSTTAHGVWSMEDSFTRGKTAEGGERTDIPDEFAFNTMHGYGHYHGDFVKTDGVWRIQKLVQTRVRLDFT
ncbi:nuclear transport factor 2 family protein [Streptomyces sp. NPDC004227]